MKALWIRFRRWLDRGAVKDSWLWTHLQACEDDVTRWLGEDAWVSRGWMKVKR